MTEKMEELLKDLKRSTGSLSGLISQDYINKTIFKILREFKNYLDEQQSSTSGLSDSDHDELKDGKWSIDLP